MKFWQVDLTTRAGAESAASTGGFVCFLAAGLTVLGLLIFGMIGAKASFLTGVIVEIAVFVTAGLRLRSGKGLVWGSVAVLFTIGELLLKLLSVTGIGGATVNVILLIGMINGVRGAWALRRDGFLDDPSAIFE